MNNKTTDEILQTEFSEQFVEGMKSRMIMSFYKYGEVGNNYKQKERIANPAYQSLHKYLDRYLQTGNTEFLMDVANFAMIEFMYPSHESAFFKPTDEGSPGIGCSVNELNNY